MEARGAIRVESNRSDGKRRGRPRNWQAAYPSFFLARMLLLPGHSHRQRQTGLRSVFVRVMKPIPLTIFPPPATAPCTFRKRNASNEEAAPVRPSPRSSLRSLSLAPLCSAASDGEERQKSIARHEPFGRGSGAARRLRSGRRSRGGYDGVRGGDGRKMPVTRT